MCRIPSKLLFSCRNLQKEFAEGSSHLSKGQEVRAARFDVNKELQPCVTLGQEQYLAQVGAQLSLSSSFWLCVICLQPTTC